MYESLYLVDRDYYPKTARHNTRFHPPRLLSHASWLPLRPLPVASLKTNRNMERKPYTLFRRTEHLQKSMVGMVSHFGQPYAVFCARDHHRSSIRNDVCVTYSS